MLCDRCARDETTTTSTMITNKRDTKTGRKSRTIAASSLFLHTSARLKIARSTVRCRRCSVDRWTRNDAPATQTATTTRNRTQLNNESTHTATQTHIRTHTHNAVVATLRDKRETREQHTAAYCNNCCGGWRRDVDNDARAPHEHRIFIFKSTRALATYTHIGWTHVHTQTK